MTDTSDSFDWFDNECVVVPEQEALAVYPNPDGDVVIRREARWDENEDPFFVLRRVHAVQFAQAILDAAGACAWVTTRRMSKLMSERPDIDWHAVNEDFNEVGRLDGPSAEHVPIKERRARVEASLSANPSRSNRAIAAECGVSDKTVGAVRAESSGRGAEFRTGEEQLKLVAGE
jgi:hypothetical protein